MKNVKLTEIQFFDTSFENQIGEAEYETVQGYSSNLKIEMDGRSFCAQWSGAGEEAHLLSIPAAVESFWGTEEDQDWANENIDCLELENELEKQGHENNFDYIKENGEKM